MDVSQFFPMWDKLTLQQQQTLCQLTSERMVKKGTVIHNGSMECTGVLLVESGLLRAYILSEGGREITLYRLFPLDLCILSADCMMKSIQFEVTVEAERDSQLLVIPAPVYKQIMVESAPLANFTNEVMANSFSNVMWLIEQIMWKSFDKRLAGFLIQETDLEESATLKLTHETIANHLGTAREVVTRMLRYFQQEGLVELSRGTIELTNIKALEQLAE